MTRGNVYALLALVIGVLCFAIPQRKLLRWHGTWDFYGGRKNLNLILSAPRVDLAETVGLHWQATNGVKDYPENNRSALMPTKQLDKETIGRLRNVLSNPSIYSTNILGPALQITELIVSFSNGNRKTDLIFAEQYCLMLVKVDGQKEIVLDIEPAQEQLRQIFAPLLSEKVRLGVGTPRSLLWPTQYAP
jgi:hypothetical protein